MPVAFVEVIEECLGIYATVPFGTISFDFFKRRWHELRVSVIISVIAISTSIKGFISIIYIGPPFNAIVAMPLIQCH